MVELHERTTALIALRPGREAALAEALRSHFGLALPAMGAFTQAHGLLLARAAPHQMLAMRDGTAATLLEELQTALGEQAGIIDLSDARIGVRIAGPRARERLASLLPIDLHPAALRPGACAHTVMAHIGVLVLLLDDAPTFEVQCARSYAGSFLRALELAGA